ncbi:MAG: hypothetical protein MUC32_07945 [Burkholderiaceae bacterium]|nr:hypothetical protein [Burkholderiaceae bacterium]
MSQSPDFTTMVPGFEFLQNLVKNAGAALPNVGQWVAPTLDPDEIDKRIGELRTVQFWLEQNAAMLGTTIQALEVQRMTLSTLKNMNVQMVDLREALTIRMPEAQAPAAAPAPSAPEPSPTPSAAAAPAAPAGVVDPMQWWSALTRQFTEIAANAMRESAAEAAGATGAVRGAAGAAAAAPAAGPARGAAKKTARKTAAAKRAAPPRRRSPAGG